MMTHPHGTTKNAHYRKPQDGSKKLKTGTSLNGGLSKRQVNLLHKEMARREERQGLDQGIEKQDLHIWGGRAGAAALALAALGFMTGAAPLAGLAIGGLAVASYAYGQGAKLIQEKMRDRIFAMENPGKTRPVHDPFEASPGARMGAAAVNGGLLGMGVQAMVENVQARREVSAPAPRAPGR